MSPVADIIKNQKVRAVSPTNTVLEAAKMMSDFNIGAVAVLDGDTLVGILTERDVVRRVVSAGRSPAVAQVREVMTANPRAVPPDESIENCLFAMREHNFRHLPVCEDGKLIGMVSLRDVLLRASSMRHSA